MQVSAPVLMIVAAMIAGPVRAELVTGNDLYSKCNSNAPEDKFWCLGFVTGVADTLPQGSKGIVCPGPNVTAGQFYDVVVKGLRDHPGMRDLPASFLAGAALGTAFPCKQ
jgi:Rap1a immunity proteins